MQRIIFWQESDELIYKHIYKYLENIYKHATQRNLARWRVKNVVKVAEKKKLDTYLASPSNPCTTQTLSACLTRRIVSWDILSSEHKLREGCRNRYVH